MENANAEIQLVALVQQVNQRVSVCCALEQDVGCPHAKVEEKNAGFIKVFPVAKTGVVSAQSGIELVVENPQITQFECALVTAQIKPHRTKCGRAEGFGIRQARIQIGQRQLGIACVVVVERQSSRRKTLFGRCA